MFHALAEQTGLTPEAAADGFLRIAVDNMARAIKKISVEKGHDVTRYALVSFGGAAGQHACAVADALGMQEVVIDPLAGVLSAYGIGLADIRVSRQHAVEHPLNTDLLAELRPVMAKLRDESADQVIAQGIESTAVEHEVRIFVKYAGTDTALELDLGSADEIRKHFENRHAREFGYIQPEEPLVVESLLIEAIGRTQETASSLPEVSGNNRTHLEGRFYSSGQWHTAAIYRWTNLQAATTIPGPAIVHAPHSTIVIEPGWGAEVTARRTLVLRRVRAKRKRNAEGTSVDPIRLEIFNNLFMSIAEQMGATLEKTSSTINIKERLDFFLCTVR